MFEFSFGGKDGTYLYHNDFFTQLPHGFPPDLSQRILCWVKFIIVATARDITERFR